MTLEIRLLTPETRATFAAIVDEANAWQRARGSAGWSAPFDDDWLLPRIQRGELFIAVLHDEPVAVFRLLWEDRPFWGDREVGDSLYLHTFAVRRSHAGRGIGAAVIKAVADMGRHRGRSRLRLDCFQANLSLVAFYERQGFVRMGTTTMGGQLMTLMEMAI